MALYGVLDLMMYVDESGGIIAVSSVYFLERDGLTIYRSINRRKLLGHTID